MYTPNSGRCPSTGVSGIGRSLILVIVSLGLMLSSAWAQAPASTGSLHPFLICYRWLLSSQADSETSWWASQFQFFVSGSTDSYRDLLREKTANPIIRYINVNNITRNEPYGQMAGHPDWDALMAWLRTNHLPRERMFYHFSQDTVCRPVNMPATTDITTENRFLQVTAASGADLTAAASKGDTTFSVLSKPGDSLLVATDERFDIVNVEVTKASFKWAGRWEYQSLLGWQPLAVQDGTGGLQRSGSVSFIPPRDWVPDSATNLYQVRLCCTRSRSGPTLRSVRSRDYIYLTANGYFFPGWQPLADTDGDGYLSPGERTGAASAHFAHEARVPAFWVGRYVMNVADPQVQQWTEVLAGIAANRITPGYDGIFVDNGWYAMPLDYLKSGGATCEPSDAATWQAGTMACLDAVRTGCGNGLVVLNTGNYTKPIYDQYLQHCDGWLGELWIRPSREFTLDLLTLPRKRDLAGKITLLHARLDPIDGDANRGKLLALSLFYLCAGERTYLFVGENYGAKPYQGNNWFGAMNASLGLPLGETMRLPASVPVYGRIFENGVVVARPLPRWDANYTDSEPVYLPEGYYQVLQADGTLGPVVTGSMVLRNAEGAILLRYL